MQIVPPLDAPCILLCLSEEPLLCVATEGVRPLLFQQVLVELPKLLLWPRGHASEKPELPTALSETPSGIRFLGPPANAMAALGDKIGSTILAQAAGVPTIPWSGSGVAVDFESCGGVIPPDIYKQVRSCWRHLPGGAASAILCGRKCVPSVSVQGSGVSLQHGCTCAVGEVQEMAGRDTSVSGVQLQVLLQACLHNIDEALAACQRIGYPIMLKASWGGGGKGIRKVRPMRLTQQDLTLDVCRWHKGFLYPAYSGRASQQLNIVHLRGAPCALM